MVKIVTKDNNLARNNTLVQDNNLAKNNKLRKLVYTINSFLGGVVTLTLLFFDPINLITPFNIFCGICWISLALCFKFSKFSLAELSLFGFMIVAIQFSATELLNFILYESVAELYFASAINLLLILVLFTAISFLLHSPKIATRISVSFIAASIATISIGTFNLSPEIRISSFTSLLEPLCYVLIAVYLVRALAIFQNEAATAKLEAKLFEQLAYSDELTGIANRRKITDFLQREIAVSKRYSTALSIILFDIDHFKKVNDNYGHNVGDKVLKTIASNCQTVLREIDLLGRWGGEEFLCVVPQTPEGGCLELAERLRLIVESSWIEDGPSVTASFGYTQFSNSDDFDSFVRRADNALYSAKENGRNRCEVCKFQETIDFSFKEVDIATQRT